uniref:Uncharacterized protein n=1 Tax=Tanacetum cinerariifolium TaxID=118510 RepID=A0A699HU47_TANCI|nr:hypothetical protein [Tanacetum cinerariifolium]
MTHMLYAVTVPTEIGSNFFRPVVGLDIDAKLTLIIDVDPMLDNIAVKRRCISLWHAHKHHEEQHPYSLEFVLQDEQGNRIQNSGKLPLLPHKYKVIFFKNINVTRVDWFEDDVLGFQLDSFSRLLDNNHEYDEMDDVVNYAAKRKNRRTVVLEDFE